MIVLCAHNAHSNRIIEFKHYSTELKYTFETVSKSGLSDFGCLELIREQVTLDETLEIAYKDEPK